MGKTAPVPVKVYDYYEPGGNLMKIGCTDFFKDILLLFFFLYSNNVQAWEVTVVWNGPQPAD